LCFFGDLKRKTTSKYIISNLKIKNTNIWIFCDCSFSFVGMLFATCKKMGSNIDHFLLVTNKIIEHHRLCSLMWQSPMVDSTFINIIMQPKREVTSWILNLSNEVCFSSSKLKTKTLNSYPCLTINHD
jgi:hypothetical protein